MRIEEVFKNVEIIDVIGELPTEIYGVTDDSRNLREGSLFFCVKGNNKNGADYISEAVAKGASIVVGEKYENCDACFVTVKDVRAAMAQISSAFYGQPQKKLKIFGVVGTNGKTSVCHILSQIFTNAGLKSAVVGTLGITIDKVTEETGLTSLGTIKFYETLARAAESGAECLFTEVSAHAIEQRRIEGVYFECLIFTNCTEDHLDYFENFERYSAVKRIIFDKKNCRYAIVNVDDEVGRKILRESNADILTYGIDNPADAFAIDVDESVNGISYIVNLFDVIYDVSCPLIGECNVYNTLASAACAAAEGIPIHKIALTLKRISAVKGRAEIVSEFNGAKIYLDYAHTPDGLKRTLAAFRKICDGRLYCLFGCGGNREKEKRPVMGAIAVTLADFAIITTDNPRFEDPCSIIGEIEYGARKVGRNYVTIEDRRKAIEYAMSKLKKGDILIVAGKGAETYQEVLGVKRTFSDSVEVENAARRLSESGNE